MSPYATTLAHARLDALRKLIAALNEAETPEEKRRCAVAIFDAPDPCDLDDEIELESDEQADEEAEEDDDQTPDNEDDSDADAFDDPTDEDHFAPELTPAHTGQSLASLDPNPTAGIPPHASDLRNHATETPSTHLKDHHHAPP